MKRTVDDSDNEIIRRIVGDEPKLFSVLVDRHKERGMALAVRMMRSKEDAEEALQDAFVRAFRGLSSFEGTAAFSTWFYRILYNVCASRLSRRGEHFSRTMDLDETSVAEMAAREPLPDVQVESTEADSIIREEVDRLPEVYGATFALFVMEDKSYDEIAEITGAPLGTVKARLFRARTMLREAVARRLRMRPHSGAARNERAA